MAAAFAGRLGSQWARFKRSFAARTLFCPNPLHADEAGSTEEYLALKLCGAEFFDVYPDRRYAALGLAAVRNSRLILGIEPCLRSAGPWLRSALDHELTHVVQEYYLGVLSRNDARRSPIIWLCCELHAHLVGGPLVASSLLLVLIFPMLCPAFGLHFS